jgi:hypothetical protein
MRRGGGSSASALKCDSANDADRLLGIGPHLIHDEQSENAAAAHDSAAVQWAVSSAMHRCRELTQQQPDAKDVPVAAAATRTNLASRLILPVKPA